LNRFPLRLRAELLERERESDAGLAAVARTRKGPLGRGILARPLDPARRASPRAGRAWPGRRAGEGFRIAASVSAPETVSY